VAYVAVERWRRAWCERGEAGLFSKGEVQIASYPVSVLGAC
jgi:hypothetical protein